MKTENLVHLRKHLTDADRDACLKLLGCGLQPKEIVDIMHISRSAVYTIRQAHEACLEQDWSTLQRLSTTTRATVDWAMRVTGADKAFAEFERTPTTSSEPEVEVPSVEPIEPMHPLNAYEMYSVLTEIRNILAEIRDTLK